jgi:hypothetical protein
MNVSLSFFEFIQIFLEILLIFLLEFYFKLIKYQIILNRFNYLRLKCGLKYKK